MNNYNSMEDFNNALKTLYFNNENVKVSNDDVLLSTSDTKGKAIPYPIVVYGIAKKLVDKNRMLQVESDGLKWYLDEYHAYSDDISTLKVARHEDLASGSSAKIRRDSSACLNCKNKSKYANVSCAKCVISIYAIEFYHAKIGVGAINYNFILTDLHSCRVINENKRKRRNPSISSSISSEALHRLLNI